ncbi:MAG: type IV pilus secretin PilQ [Pyrinomonadaceae bacterium]
MNSRRSISGSATKALLALTLMATFCIAAAAQGIDPRLEGKKYGDAGFVGEPISLNVVNADVRDILNYITEQYAINFVIDKSVKAVPVTVNVNQVPWNVALDSVMRSQDLGIQVNGTILRVADSKILATEGEVLRLQMDNKLDGSPLYTEFIRLNYARASGTISRGSTTTGTTAGSGGGGESGGASTGGEGLLPIIKRRLSRRGSIEIDGRSNSLIITDVRENIDAIRQLVAVLDQAEPQVEIEARIVVATRSFSRDVGVQMAAAVTGPGGSGIGFSTLPQSTQVNPVGAPNATASGLGANLVNTAIGMTTGIFGTAQINMLITMGEQKGQAKIIATPRVTTLNNRKASIESGTKIPITTIQPGQAAGGAVIATTTYVDVPLKLEITPQITDVGTIVLDVLSENSSTATIAAGVPPAINNQIMQTQVVVPDGGTTVVGGVLFDDERESQDRTPGLSRVPILGNLFKRKGVRRDTNEILFFITPRIYRPDFTVAAGSSGTRPNVTILQPVPMGNPTSNSGDQLNQVYSPPLAPLMPSLQGQPAPSPAASEKKP